MTCAEEADLVIAIGTTLGVFPAASIVPTAARNGAPVIIVNNAPTEMDQLATVKVSGGISDVLPEMFGQLEPSAAVKARI